LPPFSPSWCQEKGHDHGSLLTSEWQLSCSDSKKIHGQNSVRLLCTTSSNGNLTKILPVALRQPEAQLYRGTLPFACTFSFALRFTGGRRMAQELTRHRSNAIMDTRPASRISFSSLLRSAARRIASGPVSIECAFVNKACRPSALDIPLTRNSRSNPSTQLLHRWLRFDIQASVH
jgi:hypothetical protein